MCEVDEKKIEEIVEETVHKTLLKVGIEDGDLKGMQQDFIFLRSMREGSDAIKRRAVLTFVTVTIAAVAGALWVGFKDAVGH